MKGLQNGDIKSLPGPDDIGRSELPNGITLLSRSNFNSPSVVMSGYFNAGSIFDTNEKLGLAYYTAVSVMRGTQDHTFHQIYDRLESVGAGLGFSASTLTGAFSGRSLCEDLPLILATLSECLRKPVFPPQEVERLRAQFMTGLAIRAQDTSAMAALKFDELIFRDHPFARPEDGYPETVSTITSQDLMDFHKKHYGPRGMVIVLVGAISHQEAVDLVQTALEDWQNQDQEALPAISPVKPLEEEIREHIPLPGKSQTDLIMGVLGPRRASPDYFAASLGNSVLGQFGMMGRIGDVVREQAGLAYHASTSLNAGVEIGTWEVTAGVNPKNLDRAIDLIYAELNRFIGEPVTEEELADSKSNYIGRLPLSMESNAGVAGALINLERFQLGLDYYRRYPSLVNAVSVEQVLETARTYLHPEKMIVVSSGPPLIKKRVKK
ncbi:MAG: insulinase family protein [Anaerolineaceae bacterium]|nr:insulinase family protein [Anaerolineaceae bacterium]